MKTQNHKQINSSYLKFSGYLFASVFTGVLICFLYVKTSNVEINKISQKTEKYDKTHIGQINLTKHMDSLYHYISLFNTGFNNVNLLNSVSRRKQEIILMMEKMDNADVLLYKRLIEDINTFLAVKDSIRMVKVSEDMIKSDLLKCTAENKKVARKISIASIGAEK